MERRFNRRIHNLEEIFSFVQECISAYHINHSVTFLANFIIEELFTNMVKYNHTTNDMITISMEKLNNTLVISLTDYDVEPFDPRTLGEVDTTKSAQERAIGGLGIYLVKKMIDNIDYEYADRRSKITVSKRLET